MLKHTRKEKMREGEKLCLPGIYGRRLMYSALCKVITPVSLSSAPT